MVGPRRQSASIAHGIHPGRLELYPYQQPSHRSIMFPLYSLTFDIFPIIPTYDLLRRQLFDFWVHRFEISILRRVFIYISKITFLPYKLLSSGSSIDLPHYNTNVFQRRIHLNEKCGMINCIVMQTDRRIETQQASSCLMEKTKNTQTAFLLWNASSDPEHHLSFPRPLLMSGVFHVQPLRQTSAPCCPQGGLEKSTEHLGLQTFEQIFHRTPLCCNVTEAAPVRPKGGKLGKSAHISARLSRVPNCATIGC